MIKKYLSLMIGSVLATSVHAETNSFHSALKNGEFTGEIRNVIALGSYTDAKREAGPINNSHSASSALAVKYETASYEGFKFTVGFQSGHDWKIHDEDKGLGIFGGEDDHRITISSTSLHLGHLDYTFDRDVTQTNLRIGRQGIVTPLLMSSGMFPMRDAFDGVVITNTDLSDTTVKLMYINNWIMRYGDDASASVTQTDKHFDDSILSLYVNNKSISGLNIEAQWLSNENTAPLGDAPTAINIGPYDTTFFSVNYKIPESSFLVGAKYLNADIENSSDTDYWGVKAETKISNVSVRLAYTSVDDAASFPGTLGQVPMFRTYAFTQAESEYIAGVNSTSMTLGYSFDIPHLKANLTYASWNQSDEGIANSGINLDGGSELALDLKYKFKNIEGLSSRIMLAQIDFDNETLESDDMTYFRLYLNYKF